jgi:hypothetical protein
MADDETPWYRTLLISLGALLGVALIVGGVISVVALGAVSVSGLGDSGGGAAQEEPSLYIPDRTGEASPEEDDGLTLEDLNGGQDPTADDSPSASATPSDHGKEKRKKDRRARSVISLSASPTTVSAMERIDLTGTYPRGEGASLQVQRYEGGWSVFPVSASVSDGTFSTYVMTGRSGLNKFRVVDPASGKKSNVVRVRVR